MQAGGRGPGERPLPAFGGSPPRAARNGLLGAMGAPGTPLSRLKMVQDAPRGACNPPNPPKDGLKTPLRLDFRTGNLQKIIFSPNLDPLNLPNH